jgi:hypothetical protein
MVVMWKLLFNGELDNGLCNAVLPVKGKRGDIFFDEVCFHGNTLPKIFI